MTVMKLLVKSGADPKQKDSHGKLAADYILQHVKL